MSQFSAGELGLRGGIFAGVLLAMAAAEAAFPRGGRNLARAKRWPGNLILAALNVIAIRAVLPAGLVGLALAAEARGIGLFHWLTAPGWIEAAAAFALLDLAVYFQHRLFHAMPALWRFHRVHHADVDLDATTGVRFHFGEALASTAMKAAAVVLLGASPAAVLAFEAVLNAASLFNHANLKLPAAADRLLRLVIVTPDMHRVHHSADPNEMNSNYGFNFPWWDRLFRTYSAQPKFGYAGMTIGLAQFRAAEEERIGRLITQPFRGENP